MGLAAIIAIVWQGRTPLNTVVTQMTAGMDSFPLMAIPFFILAGELMERAGISERLVNLAKALVAHIQGGLGMVVIVAEYLFSGISGSTAADISAVGSLLIAPMERAGYSKGQAVAIVSAATAMGILVPPCIFMIVLASMTNQSIAAMFVAGFLPAIVIAVGLVAYVYWKAGAMGHSRSAADLLAVAATRADAGASALRQKLQPRHRTSAASSAPLPAKRRIAEIHEQHDALLVAEIPCLVLCRIAEDERLSRLPASRFLADAQRALVVHGESEVTAQHVLRPPVVTAVRLDVRTGREP